VYEALAPYAAAEPERTASAMPVLAQLLQGKPLGEEFWTEEKWASASFVWRPILPNSLTPGELVRVKVDAYDDERAVLNGKVGRVSALRGGMIINYDDEQGSTMGDRHPLDKLERQIPIRRGVTQ
jgi:hypothetical protein